MAETTLVQLNEREGFNWLMLTRWRKQSHEHSLELWFSDREGPLMIPAGPDADAVLKFLGTVSLQLSAYQHKQATKPSYDGEPPDTPDENPFATFHRLNNADEANRLRPASDNNEPRPIKTVEVRNGW